MKELLDTVPSLPKDLLVRRYRLFLGVLINTMGYGKFSYHMETRKPEHLRACTMVLS